MLQTVDFCGDRLRLSAFLRIVGDGMPQRPTRFKRCLQDTINDPKGSSSRRHNALCSSEQHNTDHRPARKSPPRDAFVFNTAQSPLPVPSLEDDLLPLQCTVTDSFNRWRLGDSQLPNTKQQAVQRRPLTMLKPTDHSSHGLDTRKRRRLPVTELALLRTTSSDGLPHPSDAEHAFEFPVNPSDPIENSRLLSCMSSTRYPTQRPSRQRIQKPILTNDTSAAKMLKERGSHFRFAQLNGVGRQRNEAAMCTDGFVGVELISVLTKKLTKPRIGNIERAKRRVPRIRGLFLVRGSLPSPHSELCGDAETMPSQVCCRLDVG
ncbi:hypothetical protein SVAN01_05408 [Stagonosporopsis vannaccii]|nr:hypothetical protein SVAN01_05408 [Stagonosporopsis vannaccii]